MIVTSPGGQKFTFSRLPATPSIAESRLGGPQTHKRLSEIPL
jgi:hypothetical protein